jgi:ribonuclease PH
MFVRGDGRRFDQPRKITVQHDLFGHAASSILLSVGQTKVLVSITLQEHVPPFLRGKKTGWLTAEYAMLPTATAQRTQRESMIGKRNQRSVEISRFVGRSLRPVVNLDLIPDKTIQIDCDVLHADGGTRAASVTAASYALRSAQAKWLASHVIEQPFIKHSVIAVSAGFVNGCGIVDLNYAEDIAAESDMTFVLLSDNRLAEMHATAERTVFSWEQISMLYKQTQSASQEWSQVLEENFLNQTNSVQSIIQNSCYSEVLTSL